MTLDDSDSNASSATQDMQIWNDRNSSQ